MDDRPGENSGSAAWLWTTGQVRAALETGDLGLILRTYRSATGTSQRRIAESLGYDPTYISMIETGRRTVADVRTRLRIARHLGIPPRVLGISDPDDADFAVMLQFGESTIRLAVLARQAGHAVTAVNELWPLVSRLEARVADGPLEPDVLPLLCRARAELGVSLGYILPDERLTSAARWTGRALRLAERLDRPDLLVLALRVHGNELRKLGRTAAAMARLGDCLQLTPAGERGPLLIQLARAVGDSGDPALFDQLVVAASQSVEDGPAHQLAGRHAVYEVRLRGLLRTARAGLAADLLDEQTPVATSVPPQWRAILDVTVGEVLIVRGERDAARSTFDRALRTAREYRLPHQVQRVVAATRDRLDDVHEVAVSELNRLTTVLSGQTISA